MKKITILTREVSVQAFVLKGGRNTLRFLRTFLKTGILDFNVFIYYGHTAVTRSLIKGLRETGASFNANPLFVKDVGETVCVLSDVSALKQAISWKRAGKIKKLIAGPNLVEIPARSNNIISSPEIDSILVPSKMVVDIYEKINPALRGRVMSWYAGVDTTYWTPTSTNATKEKEVLVYWKNAITKAFCHEVEIILKNKGYKINRIIYGRYRKGHFKKVLDRSKFAVFLSATETQGIALAEAWAMDVPTIVWNPEIEHYYLRGIKTTAAPYLSAQTGIKWKQLDELESLLANNMLDSTTFAPRQWVLENMSDRKSAELFIKLIN